MGVLNLVCLLKFINFAEGRFLDRYNGNCPELLYTAHGDSCTQPWQLSRTAVLGSRYILCHKWT